MASTLFPSVSPASGLSVSIGERVSASISRLRENNFGAITAGSAGNYPHCSFFILELTSLIRRGGVPPEAAAFIIHMLLLPGLIHFIRLIFVTIFQAGYTRLVVPRNAELKIQRFGKRPNPAFVPYGCALIAIGQRKTSWRS